MGAPVRQTKRKVAPIDSGQPAQRSPARPPVSPPPTKKMRPTMADEEDTERNDQPMKLSGT
jgi:hypothetical protein